MAIFQDSVLFNGFLFFLSTLLLIFLIKISNNHINNAKIKKIVDFIGYLTYLGVIIFIFDNHTSHYLDNLQLNENK